MEWIFHIGIAQSIFTAYLLFSKRWSNITDKILGFWMIFIALELIHMLLQIIESPMHNITSNFGFYSLTFGPFLYLYVSKLTTENSRFEKKDFLHFVPYSACSLLHLVFFTNRPLLSGEIEMEPGWFILNISRVVLLFISLSWYSILSLKIIKKHKKSIKDSFSFESSNITLNWLKRVTFIFIATYLILIINMLTGNLAQVILSTSHYIPAIGLTFFCFSLSYYGFNQPVLFQKSQVEMVGKRFRVGLKFTPAKRKSYLEKLNKFLNEEKPYLNPELTINMLADQVKVPRHYITEILKNDLKKNFFTLVNDHRIDAVKRRLKSEEYKEIPVLQLALECGFNSKSSFNAIFKQHTGQTPSEYRKAFTTGKNKT